MAITDPTPPSASIISALIISELLPFFDRVHFNGILHGLFKYFTKD